jgi:hypothetical protein
VTFGHETACSSRQRKIENKVGLSGLLLDNKTFRQAKHLLLSSRPVHKKCFGTLGITNVLNYCVTYFYYLLK